ncbi:MAG: DUF3109 family protein [Bacteroidetes bacterium]|nr:DUF3109 family protein [Bacteroidota bacterium]
MIAVGNTLVSRDVVEKEFVCDLAKCKGACCIAGESGAPLLESELAILDKIYPKIESYLTERGKAAIAKQGKYLIDKDGEHVTPLINEVEECAYTIYDEHNVAKCGIEKAWHDGKIAFRKPISCHLYPIRITYYKDYDAINYERWDVCKAACKLGAQLQVPVYTFVKDALIVKYGQAWYDELDTIAKAMEADKG